MQLIEIKKRKYFVTVNDNELIPYEYRSFHNYIKYFFIKILFPSFLSRNKI